MSHIVTHDTPQASEPHAMSLATMVHVQFCRMLMLVSSYVPYRHSPAPAPCKARDGDRTALGRKCSGKHNKGLTQGGE